MPDSIKAKLDHLLKTTALLSWKHLQRYGGHHIFPCLLEATVLTEHSAMEAVETPSPNGKHDRWWTKVFGSGVKKVDTAYGHFTLVLRVWGTQH